MNTKACAISFIVKVVFWTRKLKANFSSLAKVCYENDEEKRMQNILPCQDTSESVEMQAPRSIRVYSTLRTRFFCIAHSFSI